MCLETLSRRAARLCAIVIHNQHQVAGSVIMENRIQQNGVPAGIFRVRLPDHRSVKHLLGGLDGEPGRDCSGRGVHQIDGQIPFCRGSSRILETYAGNILCPMHLTRQIYLLRIAVFVCGICRHIGGVCRTRAHLSSIGHCTDGEKGKLQRCARAILAARIHPHIIMGAGLQFRQTERCSVYRLGRRPVVAAGHGILHHIVARAIRDRCPG